MTTHVKMKKYDFKHQFYSTPLGRDLMNYRNVSMVGCDCIYWLADLPGAVGPHLSWGMCSNQTLETVKKMLEAAFDIEIEFTGEGDNE
jgi:hypothetical protein